MWLKTRRESGVLNSNSSKSFPGWISEVRSISPWEVKGKVGGVAKEGEEGGGEEQEGRQSSASFTNSLLCCSWKGPRPTGWPTSRRSFTTDHTHFILLWSRSPGAVWELYHPCLRTWLENLGESAFKKPDCWTTSLTTTLFICFFTFCFHTQNSRSFYCFVCY